MFLNTIVNYFPRRSREFVRYCIVSAASTIIDAAVFYFVSFWTAYQIALIVGSVVGKVFSYFFTVYWTFQSRYNYKNFLGIVLAHVFNLFVVRLGCMWLFVNVLGVSDRLAYVPTLFISGVTNFLIMKFIVRRFD